MGWNLFIVMPCYVCRISPLYLYRNRFQLDEFLLDFVYPCLLEYRGVFCLELDGRAKQNSMSPTIIVKSLIPCIQPLQVSR